MRENNDIVVGDNEKYEGEMSKEEMYRKEKEKGFENVLIEVRKEMIEEN